MLLQFIQNSRMMFVCERTYPRPIINILYYWMTNPRYYYVHLSLLFIPLANTYGYLIPFRSIVSLIHSHCPILFLLVMPSSMIVSFYLSLSRITHHVLFHIAPDHDRLDLLIRPGCEQPLPFFLESRNIRFDSTLPRRSKIVSVLTTPPPPPPPPPFSHYKPNGV